MLNKTVVEIETWRGFDQQPPIEFFNDLPDVPVLSGTLLFMEICAGGASIDLHEMTQLVLGDPGATIQIMRQVGNEVLSPEERPNRIEDCISMLNMQSCMEAISRNTVTRGMKTPAILKAWSHAVEIAQKCRMMAETMPGNIGPDEAYLTGLLHELGTLPVILGWDTALGLSSNPDVAGLQLAEGWSLPRCVVNYFHEINHLRDSNQSIGIVQRAHESSSLFPHECLFAEKPEFQTATFGGWQTVSS